MKSLDGSWVSNGHDAVVLLRVDRHRCGACAGGRVSVVVRLGGLATSAFTRWMCSHSSSLKNRGG